MPRRRIETYKPWLLTTTMRNPDRLRDFLVVLKKFDGKVLTDGLCETIEGELLRKGVITATRGLTDSIKNKWREREDLSDDQVLKLLADNPQQHGEAGFGYGWPSRFDTQYKIAKWFGFVWYQIGEKVRFSDLGNMFVEHQELDGGILFTYDEQQVFLNAFARYHRKNPFQRVLNDNRPLILLIQVLEDLKQDTDFGSVGLFRHELPFLLVWKNGDHQALADYVLNFRRTHGYNVSSEVVFEKAEAIQGGWNKKEKIGSITKDYPDEILRKFRLTGLFSIRGNGRVIALNADMQVVTAYLQERYAGTDIFADERAYFLYASQVDEFLIQKGVPKKQSDSEEDQNLLLKWIEHFGEDAIKKELMNLSARRASKDEILRITPEPLRLEFLSALLLKHDYGHSKIVANYRRDDEGLPISHAPGNNSDIERYEDASLHLYEVTLMTGVAQTKAEMGPIKRHLEEMQKVHQQVSTVFVAPTIHSDSNDWAQYWTDKGFKITNKSIAEFVSNP